MKLMAVITAAVLGGLLWQSLQAGPAFAAESQIQISDAAGREVTIGLPVRRVVTTFIPATLFALCAGLKDRLVGVSNKDTTVPLFNAVMKDRSFVKVGNRSVGLNMETIFSLKPDLVILYGQKDGLKTARMLSDMGIPAIVILPESMDAIKNTLTLIGRAAGNEAHVKTVTKAMAVMENLLEEKLSDLGPSRRLSTYFASPGSLLKTISGSMFQNDMVEMAGALSVSRHLGGFYQTVSGEQLMKWAPESMVFNARCYAREAAVLSAHPLSSLPAVRNQRVIVLPEATYWDYPTPLSMAGTLWLAGQFYPDRFKEVDASAYITGFYDLVFGEGFSRSHPDVVGAVTGVER